MSKKLFTNDDDGTKWEALPDKEQKIKGSGKLVVVIKPVEVRKSWFKVTLRYNSEDDQIFSEELSEPQAEAIAAALCGVLRSFKDKTNTDGFLYTTLSHATYSTNKPPDAGDLAT